MKKAFISMLALAALASCSSEEIVNEPVDNNKPVEIKLTAGVLSVNTKAPITDGSTFLPAIVGWEGTTTPTSGKPKWTTEPNADITAGTAKAITLRDKQYYNPDGTTHTYIRAYYPKGTLDETTGVSTFTNTDGSVDLMLTDNMLDAGVKPAGVTNPTAKDLQFKHLLTQLNFTMEGDASLAANTIVRSVKVKNVQLPTGVNIFTGALTAAAATDVSLQNIPNTAIPTDGTDASLGDAIMINPLNSTDLKMDIETNTGTFTDVPVTLDASDNGEGGTSYGIVLTFKQKEISVTATVVAWTPKTGAGTVQ